MTRRGFLAWLGSVPFFGLFSGFAKRPEASPVQAKSSPPREAMDDPAFWRQVKECAYRQCADAKHQMDEPEFVFVPWYEMTPRQGGAS